MSERRKSRRRWWCAVLLSAVALLAGGYLHLTRPERLRGKLLELCRTLPVGDVRVEEVSFTPWGGLELEGCSVAHRGPVRPHAESRAASVPTWLHIGFGRVQLDWRAVLRGRLRPTEIELHNVTLTVPARPTDRIAQTPQEQADMWARSLGALAAAPTGGWPRVNVSGADLQVVRREPGRSWVLERWLFSAYGAVTEDGYTLRVEHRPRQEQALSEVCWSRGERELRLAVDWVGLALLAQVVPQPIADALRKLDTSGQVRLKQLVVSSAPGAEPDSARWRVERAELEVAGLGLAVPIEEPAGAAPHAAPPDCFLRLTDGTGTVGFEPDGGACSGDLQINLAGRLRSAPMSLALTTTVEALRRACTVGSGPLGLDDIVEGELRVDGWELPTAETYPTFVGAPRLEGPIGTMFRDYRPRGRVNLRLRAERDPGLDRAPAERISGEIEALGASCRYARFPYSFSEVQGVLRLVDGRVLFDQVAARHGPARVVVEGALNSTRSWTGFELSFRGQDVALDRDLYDALPESYRPLWNRAAPRGSCDTTVVVARPDGTAETGAAPASVKIDAYLHDGSLALDRGRRLEDAAGWLSIHDGAVELIELRGRDGAARVRLDGTIRADDPAQSSLRVEIADLPVRREAALPGAGPAIHFTGMADVWGHVGGLGLAQAGTQHYLVHLKSGRLRGSDATREWAIADGWVQVHNDVHELLALQCRQGESILEARGSLPSTTTPQPPLELVLHASTPVVEQLLPQFVTGRWAEFVDALRPSGAADVSVSLHADAEMTGAPRQVAEVKLQAARLRPQALPLDLRNAHADANLAAGQFFVSHATADYGAAGHIEISQPCAATWTPEAVNAEFNVSATGVALDELLAGAMPAALARMLDRMRARGTFDATLPIVRVAGGDRRTWRLEGQLDLRDVSARIGYDLSGLNAVWSGVCDVSGDGEVRLDTTFHIDRGQVAGRPVSQCDGSLAREPGERWVHLDGLRGKLCDGVVQGELAVDPTSGEYELSLQLHDISAAQLLPPPKARPHSARRGRLDADIWLRGRADEPSSRQGGGSVRITGASFLQTPILATIIRLPKVGNVRDTLDRAEVRFVWDGQVVRLEHVDIRSPDLRFVGEGHWNLESDAVRMTLLAAHPDHWPRLGLLSDLAESAGRELVQYRVDGTLGEPRVTVEPLRTLSEAVRRLLGEE